MGKVIISNRTIKDPFTFMGECAGIAYGSDISNPEKNKKRGINCLLSGHGRMLEFCDIFFTLEGYSIRVIREFMRHVGDGLTVIQRSTRYCDESGFNYYTPKKIEDDIGIKDEYDKIMSRIQESYYTLLKYGASKEDAANILPLGTNTVLVVKHNARTMINMAEQRLCYRALLEYRQLMLDFIKALKEYSEEWNTLCELTMKCKCDKVGWCEEEHSCGKYPKKYEVEIVKNNEMIFDKE